MVAVSLHAIQVMQPFMKPRFYDRSAAAFVRSVRSVRLYYPWTKAVGRFTEYASIVSGSEVDGTLPVCMPLARRVTCVMVAALSRRWEAGMQELERCFVFRRWANYLAPNGCWFAAIAGDHGATVGDII
jgi:hypothetical protein